jgi:hypothetical protein
LETWVTGKIKYFGLDYKKLTAKNRRKIKVFWQKTGDF